MKKNSKNDEERWSALMISAQQGNEYDYRQLLNELGNAIAAYLRSRFGAMDIIEDCVQESLIAIHQARDSYEASRLFRPWLFAIVNYKTIDVLRKRERHRQRMDEQKEREREWSHVEEHDRVAKEKQQEQLEYCGQLLLALPKIHREAIVLTKLQGLSMKEAARQLDISESAMKVRVHRALDASKQLLETERY